MSEHIITIRISASASDDLVKRIHDVVVALARLHVVVLDSSTTEVTVPPS